MTDAAVPDPAENGDTGENGETGENVDTVALERAQEAIDEGHEAAHEALKDESPDSDLDVPATGEGLESEQVEVAPRPN